MGTATAGAKAGLPDRNSTSLDSTYSFDPSFHRHAAVIAYYAAGGKGVPARRAGKPFPPINLQPLLIQPGREHPRAKANIQHCFCLACQYAAIDRVENRLIPGEGVCLGFIRKASASAHKSNCLLSSMAPLRFMQKRARHALCRAQSIDKVSEERGLNQK